MLPVSILCKGVIKWHVAFKKSYLMCFKERKVKRTTAHTDLCIIIWTAYCCMITLFKWLEIKIFVFCCDNLFGEKRFIVWDWEQNSVYYAQTAINVVIRQDCHIRLLVYSSDHLFLPCSFLCSIEMQLLWCHVSIPEIVLVIFWF